MESTVGDDEIIFQKNTFCHRVEHDKPFTQEYMKLTALISIQLKVYYET